MSSTRHFCTQCEEKEVATSHTLCRRCYDEISEESFAQTRADLDRYEAEKAAGLWDGPGASGGGGSGGGGGWIVVAVIAVIVLLMCNAG